MPESETKPALSVAGTEAIDQASDLLRGRVDLFGKTLAAIATLGTGAVGLSTISDLAPLRGWTDWLVAIAAVLCLLAAAVAAVDVAIRLMQVSQPVVIDVETTAQAGVSNDDDGDGQDVPRIFEQSARRFGFESLAGVQERERSLRAAAARATTDDERKRRTALADELRAETDLAASRARLAIIRRRSADAVSGSRSRVAYGVVAAGLLLFALLADVVTSDDSEAVATAKACAEAREAGATKADLEATSCDTGDPGSDDDDDEETPTADEVRADLTTQLTAVLADCVSHAAAAGDESAERPLSDDECTALRRAIRVLLSH